MALSFLFGSLLLTYMDSNDTYSWKGIILAIGMFVCNVMAAIFIHNFLYYTWTAGMRMKSIVNSVIYRKVMHRLCSFESIRDHRARSISQERTRTLARKRKINCMNFPPSLSNPVRSFAPGIAIGWSCQENDDCGRDRQSDGRRCTEDTRFCCVVYFHLWGGSDLFLTSKGTRKNTKPSPIENDSPKLEKAAFLAWSLCHFVFQDFDSERF